MKKLEIFREGNLLFEQRSKSNYDVFLVDGDNVEEIGSVMKVNPSGEKPHWTTIDIDGRITLSHVTRSEAATAMLENMKDN